MTNWIARILPAAAVALLVCWWGSSAAAQDFTTLFSEDFETLAMGPSVNEGVAGSAVWTKSPPAGWEIDDSGVPGFGNDATDGVTEWAGWSFADKEWWTSTAGDQQRSQFSKGQGTVAIADPDEWDDQAHSAGTYNTFLSTPSIDISGVPVGELFVGFDSSWRPDGTQVATLSVTYDGGAPIQLLRRDSNTSSPDFHPDATNESILLALQQPDGANSMVLTFGLIEAGNNWWWAFDNLKVLRGEQTVPTITRHPQSMTVPVGCAARFSVTAADLPSQYQWFKDGSPIPGANADTYFIANTSEADAGAYHVEVGNSAGSVTSRTATLSIGTEPVPRPDSPFGNRRVLLIGIDGCRVDSFLAAATPNLDALAQSGAYSWTARCSMGQGTVSGPGWSTILTGVWADKHNVNNNSFSSPNYDTYPHFFTRLREAHPTASLSSIVHWSPINQYILRDEDFQLSGLSDEQIGAQAACHILGSGPDAIFLHFDELDGAGHGGGYDPGNANYLATISRIDGYIGTVLDAVDQRKKLLGEDWLVIITSDHGGTPGGSHGGLSLDEIQVPLIVSGGRTRIGQLPGDPFNTFIVPTIYAHLGIEVPSSWKLDGWTTGLQPVLRIVPGEASTDVRVRWPGIGRLQRSSMIAGPWTEIPRQFSPFDAQPSQLQEYFRLAP